MESECLLEMFFEGNALSAAFILDEEEKEMNK